MSFFKTTPDGWCRIVLVFVTSFLRSASHYMGRVNRNVSESVLSEFLTTSATVCPGTIFLPAFLAISTVPGLEGSLSVFFSLAVHKKPRAAAMTAAGAST